MLKLVARPGSRPAAKPARRQKATREARELYVQLEVDRSLGHSAQRAVARARRTIVDVHCHAQGLEAGSHAPAPERSVETPPAAAGPTTDLARRLAEIHRRLLELSSLIELEMDRLDIVSAGVDEALSRARPAPPLPEH